MKTLSYGHPYSFQSLWISIVKGTDAKISEFFIIDPSVQKFGMLT